MFYCPAGEQFAATIREAMGLWFGSTGRAALCGCYKGSVAEKGGMTVRQANWCQCSRWESGRRKKASHHLHPESWAVIREADG